MLGEILAFAAPILGAILGNEGAEDRNQANIAQANQSAGFNAEQAAIQRQWSAEQAIQQMQFQRDMSNTSYQRAVADLEAADLNPMLAYSQGGASTPAGAQGSAGGLANRPMPELSNTLAGFASAGSAASIIKTLAETDKIEAETETERMRPEQVRRQTDLLNQQMHESISRMHLTMEQRKEVEQHVKNMLTEQEFKAAEVMLKKLEMMHKDLGFSEAWAKAKAWATEYGQEYRPYLDDVVKGVGSAGHVLRGLRGGGTFNFKK